MTFDRLLPKLRRSSARGTPRRGTLPRVIGTSSAMFDSSVEGVDRMRHEIASPSTPLVCPVCRGKLAVRGPVRVAEERQLAWMVTCLQCEHNEVLRASRHPPVQRELFDHLVESQRRGRRDVRGACGGLFVSAAFQAAVVLAAVLGTMGVAVRSAPALDTIMLTLTDVAPDAEPEPEERDALPLVTALASPPVGFQVLEAPLDIPTGIAPIDLDQRFDPRDYSGRGVEGGVFAGVQGGVGPVDQPEVFLPVAVDELPQQISAPLPKYPSMLRRAGIEGYVNLRYIVLTDGTVDPTSIVVVESSHAQFEQAAVRSVREARFRPGRMRGTPVRVLVEQRITFTLI
ncbi:MAG: energy transducer TonB [Gemmatimonadota bacterium]|nr:energy transducer TonB [Gemmatimonadota bacterium]MDH3368997.1 energy transducer TonB [Gemmatimonadota bacterium]MDH3479786.1 energy transducer TonB [Gemmatimonadota bacterium]MDH3570727.1 energy transducer TonB [Gemmatimonadota bacterium]MDH5549267.1 energy transducer TonB [Gemmatimonadota bacterium]